MTRFLIMLLISTTLSCATKPEKSVIEAQPSLQEEPKQNGKIKVLNFATFHMGTSSDATTVEFDDENKKNQEDARKIAEMLSVFKPTVICVEVPMAMNIELNEEYNNYLKKPGKASTYYGEVGLLAFELGRMNKIEKLYGIDHKLDYNYSINEDLINSLDSNTYNQFKSNPFESIPNLNVFEDGLSLMEKLKRMNHPKFLEFLILANADVLAHVGSCV